MGKPGVFLPYIGVSGSFRRLNCFLCNAPYPWKWCVKGVVCRSEEDGMIALNLRVFKVKGPGWQRNVKNLIDEMV